MARSRPTVYDVAERAGVSIATVSFTFRQPSRVKESTRQTVEAAARELGYIPSASARGLAGGRTGALGLLTRASRPTGPDQDIDRSTLADQDANCRLFPLYFDEVERGVAEECWRRGYAVMVAGAHGLNSEAVLTDIAGRVDGLAVLSDSVSDDQLERIADRLPVVMLSESGLGDGIPQVNADNAGGIRALVEHLCGEHSFRDLAFVGALLDADRRQRFEAFRLILRERGLHAPEEPIAGTDDHEVKIRDLMTVKGLPGAFVCETDEVALALMDTLREMGIDVPRQVAVTGYDGIVAGRLSSPQLTTVRQPMQAMGAEAVRILVDHIEQTEQPARSRRFPVQLLVRQSCGCSAE